MNVRRARAGTGVALLVVSSMIGAFNARAGNGDANSSSASGVEDLFEATKVYFDGAGEAGYSTAVPGSSLFHTSGLGRGGGGAPVACKTFDWNLAVDNPSAGVIDPVSSVPAPETVDVPVSAQSFAWVYHELVPTGEWTPELQGRVERNSESGPRFGLQTPIEDGERFYAENAPLPTATRRFRRNCKTPVGFENDKFLAVINGEYGLGFVDVPLTDPFWNPLTRLGILWGMIQLPTYRVIAPPEVNTYGGLVVNMPTWLQIEAAAWRPYFTDVDEYMGWTSQLGLFPERLDFEVVGAGGGTIPCAPEESAARGGAIPGMPDDLPDFYELGQLGEDCTWVPQEPGQVTARARITYRVLLTISGYSEWLSPYVWYSDPLTLPINELRVRNVTPPGGVEG